MKRTIAALTFLAVAPLFGIETDDCSAARQLAALYQVRGAILKNESSWYDVQRFIDDRIVELRVPLPDGGYRWVRWVRPAGNPDFDKKGHRVVAIYGSGSDNFEASGSHAFAVRIAVPSKRTLFNANNAVWVGTVHVKYSWNGRERTKDESINAWMNPDTSRTIDLGTIADRVDVSLDSATGKSDVREALVEIHILKAVAEDDPANPNYETIASLRRLRESRDPDAIDDEIARIAPADSMPIVHLVGDLRRADDLLHSKKQEDQEKGQRLLKETLRRLR